jgi:16S rRNA (cytosine1402-N4)-methyltransferase
VPIREEEKSTVAKVITSKPVTATDEEIDRNPRARSAKLRAIEVL